MGDDFAEVEGLPAEIASILTRGDFPTLADDEFAKLGPWLTANARKHYDGLDPANLAKTRRMEEAKRRLRAILEYNAALGQAAAFGAGAGDAAQEPRAEAGRGDSAKQEGKRREPPIPSGDEKKIAQYYEEGRKTPE